MKMHSHISAISEQLCVALTRAQHDRQLTALMSELQRTLATYLPLLQSAWPETYSKLVWYAACDHSRFPVQYSSIELDAYLRMLEPNSKRTAKEIANYICWISHDLLVFKLLKNCPDCKEEEFGCYSDEEQSRLFFCCELCGFTIPCGDGNDSTTLLYPASLGLLQREGIISEPASQP